MFFKLVILMFYLPIDLINIYKWVAFKIDGFINKGQNPEIIKNAELITHFKIY